jgi:formylglycine-generating enzyme required for sulfatase activity
MHASNEMIDAADPSDAECIRREVVAPLAARFLRAPPARRSACVPRGLFARLVARARRDAVEQHSPAFALFLLACLTACTAPHSPDAASSAHAGNAHDAATSSEPEHDATAAREPEHAAGADESQRDLTAVQPIRVPPTWSQKIAGTTLEIELVSIPSGSIDVADPSANGATRRASIDAFSLAKLEIPWEVYDAFVFGLDQPSSATADGADAVTRPSHPYISMDRGFGHAGYPVISVSFHGAQEFCRWLSLKSGRVFRLPSEIEWEYACRAGRSIAASSSADAHELDVQAWFRDNAHAKTHPCGEKAPNPWGLRDMLGNAAEWCTSADGKGVVRGGSFRDDASAVSYDARKRNVPAWNKSDPQLPRGIWWLADAPFVGFRVACDAAAPGTAPFQR